MIRLHELDYKDEYKQCIDCGEISDPEVHRCGYCRSDSFTRLYREDTYGIFYDEDSGIYLNEDGQEVDQSYLDDMVGDNLYHAWKEDE